MDHYTASLSADRTCGNSDANTTTLVNVIVFMFSSPFTPRHWLAF
jgi:hypothetical protein